MSFTVEKDIMVPMRDGVRLATDAWVPAGGAPGPVLLVRLPYSKDMIEPVRLRLAPNLFALIEAGYAVVYQDCRGTFRSGGEFTPMRQRAQRRRRHRGLAAGAALVRRQDRHLRARPTWASSSGRPRPPAAT